MDLVGSIILLFALMIIFYTIIKKNVLNPSTVGNGGLGEGNIEEEKRRNRIMETVNEILKESKFIRPIATWRGSKIYKFVVHEGEIYEFTDIMPPERQKIGVDDDFLCFQQLAYKKVKEPLTILKEIENEKQYNFELV